MVPYLLVIASALMLSACTMSLREAQEPAVLIDPPSVYTREQVDAINAEAECKRMARNMVQIARCDTRR